MSGHSKWANIKRRKAAVDAQKGRIFTRLTREIIVAARQGGGNPESNMRLKTAIEKARAANLPMENIQRAIARGTGELEGVNYEELVYEGFGPGGVAVIVDAMTDNRNRTTADVRHIFQKHGGSLGETGSVAWMFDRKGVITVNAEAAKVSEDDMILVAADAGAEDVSLEDGVFEITTAATDLEKVRAALEKQGIPVESAEVTRVPKTTVSLSGEAAEKVLRLADALEEHDDVQEVFMNADIQENG